MTYKFTSNRPSFSHRHNLLVDNIVGRMAMDIEVNLKTKSGMPVKSGAMKSDTRHFKSPLGNGYRVEIGKSYAAYQERGKRLHGTHIVRHYSTPGTGHGFFKRAIDMVIRNKSQYINEAKRAFSL